MEHKEKVQAHFNQWAREYDTGSLTGWFRTFQDRVIRSISVQPHSRILDVGCGTGWAVLRMSRLLADGCAYGVDLSPGMIAKAKANAQSTGATKIQFRIGDAEHIPHADGKFDTVICTHSFHHYPGPIKALKEFRRVLKKGGRAYILDTCRDGHFLVPVFLYDLAHRVLIGDHVRYYYSSEIKEFFQQAGFSGIREEFREQKLFFRGKILTSQFFISGEKS